MPWDGMELWVADVRDDGGLGPPEHVAGSSSNWTTQPQWSADGTLYFVGRAVGLAQPLPRTGAAGAARAGTSPSPRPRPSSRGPSGSSAPDLRVRRRRPDHRDRPVGRPRRAVEHRGRRLEHRRIELPWTELGGLRVRGDRAVFSASSPTTCNALVLLDLATGRPEVLRCGVERRDRPATRSRSRSRSSSRPRAGSPRIRPVLRAPEPRLHRPGRRAAAAHRHQPRRPDRGGVRRPQRRDPAFTSRGFAVLDVDYGGSTGYGRDVPQAARGPVGRRRRRRLRQRRALAWPSGASSIASGWRSAAAAPAATRPCARSRSATSSRPASATSASATSIRSTARPTSSSRATPDAWSGRCPAREALWRERSPLNFADRIACPVLILQGLEDRVVPPVQAEQIVDGPARQRRAHAYLAFEGEDHGFRKAENIIRSFEAELQLLRPGVRLHARRRHRTGHARPRLTPRQRRRAAAKEPRCGTRTDSSARAPARGRPGARCARGEPGRTRRDRGRERAAARAGRECAARPGGAARRCETWLRDSAVLPPGTDLERLDRAAALFREHGLQMSFILSTASLVWVLRRGQGRPRADLELPPRAQPVPPRGETSQFCSPSGRRRTPAWRPRHPVGPEGAPDARRDPAPVRRTGSGPRRAGAPRCRSTSSRPARRSRRTSSPASTCSASRSRWTTRRTTCTGGASSVACWGSGPNLIRLDAGGRATQGADRAPPVRPSEDGIRLTQALLEPHVRLLPGHVRRRRARARPAEGRSPRRRCRPGAADALGPGGAPLPPAGAIPRVHRPADRDARRPRGRAGLPDADADLDLGDGLRARGLRHPDRARGGVAGRRPGAVSHGPPLRRSPAAATANAAPRTG